MTTPEDPNNIADALVADGNDPGWVKAALMTFASAGCEVVPAGTFAAAGLEIARAGTADRLTAAQAEHDKVVNWADAALDRRNQKIAELTAERDAAEARLAALLDAIGDPRRVRSMTVTLHPGKSWYPTGPWMLRIADAAAAAREDQ